MKSGLNRISPNRKDYSLLHTFGAITPAPDELPSSFSIFDGRTIPNQELPDSRFTPALPPLPMACVAETAAFDSGIQDNKVYNPEPIYRGTPGREGGRDIREVLQYLIDHGPDGTNKRTAYFNVYGAGAIDDFDAARIAVWINQVEKRGVWVGTYWYPEFSRPNNGILPIPSYITATASGHCHLVTGWVEINGVIYLEDISWQGTDYANFGIDYISRENYNALLAQPFTGAFTITKLEGHSPVPIGYQALVDHVVYSLNQFIKQLFHV